MPYLADTPWDQPRSLMTSSQDAEFHQFARLPPEIRCQIWRFSWTPREFSPYNFGISRMSHGRNGVPRLLKAPLPVTACVNHESRQETLRKYSKVPTSAPFFSFMSIQGSICDVGDVMNYEIDSVRIDCCPLRRIAVRQFPPVVLQRLQRIEATLPRRRVTYTVGGGGHKSFDNFLRYAVAAFFPSLRELTVELDLDLHLGENVSFKIVGASCLGVARTIGEKPLFLRTVGGGGVHISMTNSHRGGNWKTINLLFMREKEALRYANRVRTDPKMSRNFLDRLGIYLWHIFTIEGFLWGDQTVRDLLLHHRRDFVCR